MIKYDSACALEKHICPECGAEHTHKVEWRWSKFFIGKLKNTFIAFATYMVLQFITLLSGKVPTEWFGHVIIVSASVTGVFMLYTAISAALSKAEIKGNFNVGTPTRAERGMQ